MNKKVILVFTPLMVLLGLSIYSIITIDQQISNYTKLDNDWTAYARISCVSITAGYVLVILRYLDQWFPDKQQNQTKVDS